MESDKIALLVVAALPVLLAITVHEAAHAYVARHFGDHTAEKMGRISLNPLRHIDPFGTVLLPILLFMTSGFLFGYAKPVPVNFGRLRRPKEDMCWVAAAGPGANLLMTLFWGFVQFLAKLLPETAYTGALETMGLFGIYINLGLMFLNLLPIPPLDGGRIVTSLLPMRQAIGFARIEPYGMPILLLLLFVQITPSGGLALFAAPRGSHSLLSVILDPLMSLGIGLIRLIFPLF